MTASTLLLALVAGRYLTADPGVYLDVQRAVYVAHVAPLMLHVGGSIVALTVGPWQFVRRIRSRHPAVHRLLGRIYLLAVLAGCTGGLLLSPLAYTGPVAGLAFALLAVCTAGATATALVAIRRRQVSRHRAWMTRSYALIFTGVTLRLWLAVLSATGLDFATTYRLAAWISWPLNLVVAELLLEAVRRRAPRRPPRSAPGRARAPGTRP